MENLKKMLNRYKKERYTLVSIGGYPEDTHSDKVREMLFERLGSCVADQCIVSFPNFNTKQPLMRDITKKIWKKYGK